MPEPSSSASRSPQSKPPLERYTSLLIAAYQVVVLASLVALPFLAYSWLRLPFPGAFIEHTLMVSASPPTQPGSWDLQGRGLPFGHQLVALNDVPLQSPGDLVRLLGQYSPGDPVTLLLRTPAGTEQAQAVVLRQFPLIDQISYFVAPLIAGLAFLASGLYVYRVRRADPAGRTFALFTAAAAFAVAGLFETLTTNRLTIWWTLSTGLAGGALFSLAMIFPEEISLVKRYPFLRWVGHVLGLALALSALPTLYNFEHPLYYVAAWRLEYLLIAVGALLFLVKIIHRWLTSASPVAREQSRLILWGAAIACVPPAVWLLVTVFIPTVTFTPLLFLFLAAFPLMTGYAFIRYRMLNTDYLINRAILYGVLSVLAVGGYALLVSGVSLLFGGVSQATNPILVGLMVFVLAVVLDPVRIRVQQIVDTVFFRGQIAYRSRLQTFGRELTQVMELPEITALLRRYTQESLAPAPLHIFIHDPLSGHYVAVPDENRQPTTDLRFPPNNALVQALVNQRETIFLTGEGELPAGLELERVRLALLGSELFIPLPGRQALIGWLALGPRRSGEPYTTGDLAFLASLSNQTALAVERAQVMANLERRVREMNVLTRVAQGTNFTVVFDDILELIYAQTNQVIPARDFWVTLEDKEVGSVYHAFFLQKDERIAELENKPIMSSQGLEPEVLKTQHALLTADYERECVVRGCTPITSGLYAWMGVPLNAGASTIGVISIGSRDPDVVYTEEQRNLLQAIADQTAGAIVKARLLQESERRARQLATLNEIGRSLTSTLEIKPLLSRILKSATEILNCAAGSLFLVDEQTGELVFEVVIGPVASDLVGRRLPPGKGVVGEAVISGRAIIANDAKRRKEWFAKTDKQTGFDTQDLLVVPMMVQNRVIGVIEVINKQDGAPFTSGDQELLITFSSQASIAIENARLYTMTDEALTERVEELQVMQRIDRELNASLEIDRAMRITLEWAMRQSKADAGLVGFVEENGVRVMTSQGYTTELAIYQEGDSSNRNGNAKRLPVDAPGLRSALESGQPALNQVGQAGDATDGSCGLLNGARSQIVIPIRREQDVIGLLLLESRKPETVSEEILAFLTRLSDHAAIAIANAQLYAEVQEANLAKSKFVSFVAHELKNPMASIKGYTELVIKGMAGPVNDLQAGFLNTVRSNVDRMNTIVSDLNDVTKIQVGSLRLEYKAVEMGEVIDEVVRSLRHQLDEKQQQIILAVPGNLPPVWADQNRLGQILTNLVSNAHKYTQMGGEMTIGAEACRKEDENHPSGLEVVHVWVKDTGIGIPPEDQPKIFQSYFRTDISKDAAPGTGLGLNITRSLVEMQGGQIWFESEQGKGTVFHITVPVAEAA